MITTHSAATLALAAFISTAAAQTEVRRATAVTPSVTVEAASPDTGAVGISSREGLTMSGAEVLITRNGVTEKLAGELALSNGLRVRPNGTILTADGGTLTLRPGQVLTFDGKFTSGAAVESAVPAKTTTAVTETTTSTTPVPAPAPTKTEVTPATASEIAAGEAERRAKAGNVAPDPAR